jgi:hypothetical protein
MWLLTTQGFYSVVQHGEDANFLLVRARVRSDLAALTRLIPNLEIFETPDADYRWRATVTRMQWQVALTALGREIDYDNFKGAVRERSGGERAALYGRVWDLLMSLQREDADEA